LHPIWLNARGKALNLFLDFMNPKQAIDMSDVERVKACLEYLKTNTARTEWTQGVHAEARALGLLPPLKPVVGSNCRPGIDRGIVYGGDMAD
jgi:hypothetical protein